MADVNAPVEQAPAVAPPTRTDEQILPRIRWVPIGKSNCYLDAEKSQSNPIYKIAVDILKQTNFFKAFTASSTIPAIYIQQFWDTICYDRTDGGYKCQLDEQWFNLTKDTLRDALQITPVNNNKAFSSPPTQDTLINFVNDLGYPKEVKHLSNVVTNDMFQPWRALTTIINLCLTGKTSGFERPRAPVLQILWGVINRAHIDYAERMWEEFTQSIHTFTEDKKNLAQHTQGKKKATLIVIPSVRFTKLIIFHLQRKHKFHPRPESPLHLPTEEPILGYLKFSAKGTKREVFGMPIPNELITDDIRGADYYDAYLKKVAKHQRYLAGEEVSDPDSPAPKPTCQNQPNLDGNRKFEGCSRFGILEVTLFLPVVFMETDTGKFTNHFRVTEDESMVSSTIHLDTSVFLYDTEKKRSGLHLNTPGLSPHAHLLLHNQFGPLELQEPLALLGSYQSTTFILPPSIQQSGVNSYGCTIRTAEDQAYHLGGDVIGRDHIFPLLEGPCIRIVKVFLHDVSSSPVTKEECHKTPHDQVDDAILWYMSGKPLPRGGDPGTSNICIPSDFERSILVESSRSLEPLSHQDKKILTTGYQLMDRNLVIRQRVYTHFSSFVFPPRSVYHLRSRRFDFLSVSTLTSRNNPLRGGSRLRRPARQWHRPRVVQSSSMARIRPPRRHPAPRSLCLKFPEIVPQATGRRLCVSLLLPPVLFPFAMGSFHFTSYPLSVVLGTYPFDVLATRLSCHRHIRDKIWGSDDHEISGVKEFMGHRDESGFGNMVLDEEDVDRSKVCMFAITETNLRQDGIFRKSGKLCWCRIREGGLSDCLKKTD
ncbi:hypothetical protein Tco_1122530 [Tanacetum coccineum]|uniref:Monodehydroascorbate reductase n=1 Tax=Tanacetum coccineum TaxID=301880 RepID=A0ABQ5J275_9ASTR